MGVSQVHVHDVPFVVLVGAAFISHGMCFLLPIRIMDICVLIVSSIELSITVVYFHPLALCMCQRTHH